METLTRTTTRIALHRADGCCGTVVPPVLDADRAACLARRYKALGDITRLTILITLARNDDPVCACDLGDDVDLEQPTVAHHLKVLRDAGLVATERRGKWGFYQLHPDAATWVRATVAASP